MAEQIDPSDDLILENDMIKLLFDPQTHLLSSMTDKSNWQTTALQQEFLYYESNSATEIQASGAYIFRPKEQHANPFTKQAAQLKKRNGKIVAEMQQIIDASVSQIIRLNKGSRVVEFEYTIGPIDVSDGVGREIITRYSTKIDSQDTFYTDSNGRDVMKRVRNYRPTWKLENSDEPLASNYYPVTNFIFINDTRQAMTIVTDRSQGGSSLVNGQIELMLHRRALYDDDLGVGEPLDETEGGIDHSTNQRIGRGLVITGKHYLMLSDMNKKESFALQYRQLQMRVNHPIQMIFAPFQTVEQYTNERIVSDSIINTDSLHSAISVLTLYPLGDDELLLRLSHHIGLDEMCSDAVEVTVDITNLFSTHHFSAVIAVREYSLTNTVPIEEMLEDQLHWSNESEISIQNQLKQMQNELSNSMTVTIRPMEIRTFRVKFATPN